MLLLNVISNEWPQPFTECFWIYIQQSGVLTVLFGCYMAGTMWNCCQLGAHFIYTIQPHTSLQCHFVKNHMHRVHVCVVVTCHLHFGQDDRDLLCATAVTWGWNRYWNMSQHRELTLGKKIIPLLLPGLKPETLWSQVWHYNHWAIPATQITLLF